MKIKYMKMILTVSLLIFSCRDINDTSKEQTDALSKTNTVQDLNYLHFDGQKFDKSFKILDVDNNEMDLHSIFNTPKIVLRLKEEHCSSCVNFMLKHLNEFEGKSNVVVLYAHSSRRTIKLKWMDDKLDLPVFLTERDFDDMFTGGVALVPYMFVLGADMKVSCFHFPKEGDEDSMKQYLSVVYARILSGSL